MTTLAKVVFAAAFALAIIWTVFLWRIARPRHIPRTCSHRWRTIERYPAGHKKDRCEKCGNIRLITPAFRRPWL